MLAAPALRSEEKLIAETEGQMFKEGWVRLRSYPRLDSVLHLAVEMRPRGTPAFEEFRRHFL